MTNKHSKIIDEIIICLNRIDDNNYTNADIETILTKLSKLRKELKGKETK